jgi:hypothetical protein
MEFKLRMDARYFDNKELLDDIKRVAGLLKVDSISREEYDKNGKFHSATIYRRFKGWNNALKNAGLKPRMEYNISEKDLFDNLENIWKIVGIQPSTTQMDKSPSKFSSMTYRRRFGSWLNACKSFIKYKKNDPEFIRLITKKTSKSRTINQKTRLKIFKRDNYTCTICGKSPATCIGVTLHIDHIKPFSKGGNNNLENLRTLCDKCNIARGNDESL